MDYLFPAPAVPALPIVGSNLRFPVRRIYCVARNYLDHIRELGNDEKAPPFFFFKAADMLVQNGATVPYPALTQNFQHEVELVAAMKSGGLNIPVEQALDHVFGYAIGLDMTRRDIQQAAAKSGRPWEIGKSFDYSAPCGPIYPVSQVGHFTEGKLQVTVNGQVRQDSDLKMMIWSVPHIIHHLSQQVEIAAGDLIYTGTPSGVGPVVSGDEMIGRIDMLGELRIRVA